jgi:hypothetical protein
LCEDSEFVTLRLRSRKWEEGKNKDVNLQRF